ncbi:MAG: hypothetical protein HOV79_05920 [Hamadaea sp.]|nr:hypothetical protein [Hamadaea sp.]
MAQVTCVVCGHTDHGDSSYCMNPTCGELLPVAIRTASRVDAGESQPAEAATLATTVDTLVEPLEERAETPEDDRPEPVAVRPAATSPGRRTAVAAVSRARRWLLGFGAAVILFGLAVAFSRGTARPSSPEISPGALPRASQVAAMAPQITGVADERVTVTLTIADRSGGKAAFYAVGGPIGGQPTTMGDAARGATSVRILGVNPEVEYCFVVVAVLSVDEVAPSAQVCTNRFGTKKP